MKREIKFRSFYSGRMIMPTNKTKYKNVDFWSHNELTPSDRERAKMIVMQCTGLRDKDGKEIYEGDVLETESGIGFVVWNDAAFAIKSPGSEAIDWVHSCVYEKSKILGNIHEQPHLIA